VWVLYHLQVIGEACRNLSDSFRVCFPDPVWSKATGLRNILVHHYFEIDDDLVWEVVEHDLPSFQAIVDGILKQMPEAPPGPQSVP
jgi:uncharacterized protein with HEPN domain